MPQVSLEQVTIDDVTWGCATRARRAEWQQTIADLIAESIFEAEQETSLRGYLTVHRDGIEMSLHDPGGHEVGRLQIPQITIIPLFREYMATVREMMSIRRGVHSPHFEALDIAKKLTHDDAAETLMRHFQNVVPDHGTARRLFTLLVVLTHDTTKLGGLPVSPG